jgi:hypothetical protein
MSTLCVMVIDAVRVECDLCHRIVAMIVCGEDGHVHLDGPRIADLGADTSPFWRAFINSPQASTYNASNGAPWEAAEGHHPAGVFILAAFPPGDYASDRHKIICASQEHVLYECTVSGLAATWTRANVAGQDHIGMRDVHP